MSDIAKVLNPDDRSFLADVEKDIAAQAHVVKPEIVPEIFQECKDALFRKKPEPLPDGLEYGKISY